MKKDSIYIILSSIGLAVIGLLSWRQDSGDECKRQIERRKNKMKEGNRNPSKVNEGFSIESYGDDVDMKFRTVISDLLETKDINIHNVQTFMSRFITTLTTRHADEDAVMSRSPKNTEQLVDLIKKYGLYEKFRWKLELNNSLLIVRQCNDKLVSDIPIRKKMKRLSSNGRKRNVALVD
jgi:hypothetical protein